MKRSEINRAIRRTEAFAGLRGFPLPPFCVRMPEDRQKKSRECDEIRDNILSRDVTGDGAGDFSQMGVSLVKVRNGSFSGRGSYPRPYAEKLLYRKEDESFRPLCNEYPAAKD